MYTGINAGTAANTEVMIDRHMVTRTVVAQLNRTEADTAVTVSAFFWINIDYRPKMLRIRIFIHKLPVIKKNVQLKSRMQKL